MQSKILILDEPTSGQDGKETKELLALLRQLNSEGITILLITHDMEIMASECSRAIIMGHRTVSFDGTPEELFQNLPMNYMILVLQNRQVWSFHKQYRA